MTAGRSLPALYCASCGFGLKADRCVRCEQPFAKDPAEVCAQCGFGHAATRCVRCEAPFAKVPAKLCRRCAMPPRKCTRCDKTLLDPPPTRE